MPDAPGKKGFHAMLTRNHTAAVPRNELFSRGTRPSGGLTAGTYHGYMDGIEVRERQSDGEPFLIFKGHIDHNGATHLVSAAAAYDTTKTRKTVRWLLAINGLTPEDAPDDVDLSELSPEGPALFHITFERREQDPATRKWRKVPTEFPQLADVTPLPKGGQAPF